MEQATDQELCKRVLKRGAQFLEENRGAPNWQLGEYIIEYLNTLDIAEIGASVRESLED